MRALALKIIEDLSNKEMKRFLQESTTEKWLYDLALEKLSPDHSYFCDFRKWLGTKKLMHVFAQVQESLKI